MKVNKLGIGVSIFLLTWEVAAQSQAKLGNLVLKLLCFFFFIFPAILTLLLVVGGFLILRGGREKRIAGKKLISNAVIAFFILIFLAWLVTLTSDKLNFGDYAPCFVGGEAPIFPVTTTLPGEMAPWADARGSAFPPPPLPQEKEVYAGPEATVYFDGSKSIDFDGTIVKYEWDFGDGNTGNGISVSHVYLDKGNYTVELKVTDDDDLSANDFVRVYLYPLEAHILKPENDSAFVNGSIIEFVGEGKYGTPCPPPESPYNYTWESDLYGPLSNEKDFNINSSNLSLGTHEITLTVEDCLGSTAMDSIIIHIAPPLVAEILIPVDDNDSIDCFENFSGTVRGGKPPYDVVWKANGVEFASGTISTDGGKHSTSERPLESGIYNITFEAEDSYGLTAFDEKKNINVSVCTADVLIVALKSNLQSVYSSGQITQLENKIEDYRVALKDDGLSSIFLYLDEDETSDIIGSKVTNPSSWSNIDAILDQLIPKLESEYLVIIGGYNRFVQAPIGSSTGSDDPYGDDDGDYRPDIPVGRFPDPNGGDLAVILNALDTSINLHNSGGLSLSSHIAPIMGCGGFDNKNWNSGKCFCSGVWGGACSACGSCCGCINPPSMSGKDFVMILAHGPGPSSGDFYHGGCLNMGPGTISSLDVSQATWMAMSCGGGNLKLKSSTSGSMAMTFLKNGGAVYFGSTNNNYGNFGGCPVLGGDTCIGTLYSEIATRFSSGKRIGDAYREGKNAYLGNPSYKCWGLHSYQGHINCLYGDPTLKIVSMW